MLNFAVGPVTMDKEILDIGSDQIPYFRTEDFSNIMIENEQLLIKNVKATDSSKVIFLTGSGTAAMEATIMNLFSEKDKILIINGGTFGKRFKEICDIHGLQSEEIKLNYFETLTEEHLIPYDDKNFTGFLINVHETSTGVLYDMNLVRKFCKRNNLFLVVDAISSFLADPYDMKAYEANVTILSSQKALALPPGMAYVIVDDEAQNRISNNRVKSLYFNFKDYLNNGIRGQTPYTPAVSNLLQLHQRLKTVDKKGVDNIVKEVAQLAQDFRTRIVKLPLEIVSHCLSNALTPLKPIGKMSADEIFKYLKNNSDIFVVPNGGELSKLVFRVGHIGSISTTDNTTLINILYNMYENGVL